MWHTRLNVHWEFEVTVSTSQYERKYNRIMQGVVMHNTRNATAIYFISCIPITRNNIMQEPTSSAIGPYVNSVGSLYTRVRLALYRINLSQFLNN